MRRPAPPELAEILAPFDDEIAELAVAMRDRVLASMPDAHEFVWDATNAVSLVYAPGTRWQDGVVHVAVYATRVNLGFNQGVALADPLRILTGTGTRIRHVTFRTPAELDVPWIEDYLRAALDHAGLGPDMGDRGTTVRVSAGPKRRPG